MYTDFGLGLIVGWISGLVFMSYAVKYYRRTRDD
jgi:hypothetical protein